MKKSFVSSNPSSGPVQALRRSLLIGVTVAMLAALFLPLWWSEGIFATEITSKESHKSGRSSHTAASNTLSSQDQDKETKDPSKEGDHSTASDDSSSESEEAESSSHNEEKSGEENEETNTPEFTLSSLTAPSSLKDTVLVGGKVQGLAYLNSKFLMGTYAKNSKGRSLTPLYFDGSTLVYTVNKRKISDSKERLPFVAEAVMSCNLKADHPSPQVLYEFPATQLLEVLSGGPVGSFIVLSAKVLALPGERDFNRCEILSLDPDKKTLYPIHQANYISPLSLPILHQKGSKLVASACFFTSPDADEVQNCTLEISQDTVRPLTDEEMLLERQIFIGRSDEEQKTKAEAWAKVEDQYDGNMVLGAPAKEEAPSDEEDEEKEESSSESKEEKESSASDASQDATKVSSGESAQDSTGESAKESTDNSEKESDRRDRKTAEKDKKKGEFDIDEKELRMTNAPFGSSLQVGDPCVSVTFRDVKKIPCFTSFQGPAPLYYFNYNANQFQTNVLGDDEANIRYINYYDYRVYWNDRRLHMNVKKGQQAMAVYPHGDGLYVIMAEMNLKGSGISARHKMKLLFYDQEGKLRKSGDIKAPVYLLYPWTQDKWLIATSKEGASNLAILDATDPSNPALTHLVLPVQHAKVITSKDGYLIYSRQAGKSGYQDLYLNMEGLGAYDPTSQLEWYEPDEQAEGQTEKASTEELTLTDKTKQDKEESSEETSAPKEGTESSSQDQESPANKSSHTSKKP